MSDAERIKDAIRIEQYIGQYVELKRASNLYKTCCPHHADKTPSFIVNPENQSWHCYGACGEGGDVIAFAMKHHNLTFGEALEELARYAGITLTPLSAESKAKEDKRERIYTILEDAVKFFEHVLSINAEPMRYLLKDRGLSPEIIASARIGYARDMTYLTLKFQSLGYSNQELLDSGLSKKNGDGSLYDVFRNRLMIPVRDARGRVIGLIGRAMAKGQEPKYLYNTNFEKSSYLHRMPRHDTTRGADSVVCVEGSIDPLSAYNRQIYNVVSLMGSSLSETQLTLLAKIAPKIIFCFDNDTAGKTATERLGSHLQTAAKLGVELYVISPPCGKDPDDTFRERPELWQGAVDAARPVVDVLIDLSIGTLPQNAGAIDKSKEIKRLLKLFTVENPLVTRENREKIAVGFKVREDDLDKLASDLFDIRIVVRNMHIKPTTSHLPTCEEWVLHGLIVNDDQMWLERANARLLTVSDRPMAYALRPLNLNDFTHDKTRKLWSMIAELVKANERPFFHQLEADVKDTPMQETYERLYSLDITARELGYPCFVNYETFIDHVYRMRTSWLKEELKSLDAPKEECLTAIALLNLAQEELV